MARDPGRLLRFEREARAVAALNHPNVLTVYDVGTHRCEADARGEGAAAGPRVPYVVPEPLEEFSAPRAKPAKATASRAGSGLANP